ncbi:indolepyruvate ferredoxin oxidoreductase, partial [mine drainage metagenome]
DGVAFTHRVTAQLLGATLIELERSLYGSRLEMARRYAALNGLDRVTAHGARDVVGIVAAGPAYRAVEHALRRAGLDERDLADAGVRLVKVAVPHPLNEVLVREFARDLHEVIVVEDKRGFLEKPGEGGPLRRHERAARGGQARRVGSRADPPDRRG